MATAEDQREAHAEEATVPEAADEAPRESPAEEHASEVPPQEKQRGRMDFIPDIVRRTFYAGLGAVFTTEEGIRKIASDLKLPKDVANYLIQSAAGTKDELFRVVGRELRGFLETVNISGELQKLLTSLSFEIKTEIRFIPNDEAIGGVKPDVKVGRFSFKRHRDEDKKKKDKDGGGEEPKS
jgi:hypothetical protein